MATSSDKSRQMQKNVTCDKYKITAKYLCTNCQDRLCDSCKDILSKSTSPSGYLFHQVCKKHPNFRACIGCQKCDVPVCEKCLVGEHNRYNLIELQKKTVSK